MFGQWRNPCPVDSGRVTKRVDAYLYPIDQGVKAVTDQCYLRLIDAAIKMSFVCMAVTV